MTKITKPEETLSREAEEVGEKISRSRRAALARLGIGAAIAYSAPVIIHLDRSAHAAKLPTPCPRGSRKPACQSAPSKSSKSSKSSSKKKKRRR